MKKIKLVKRDKSRSFNLHFYLSLSSFPPTLCSKNLLKYHSNIKAPTSAKQSSLLTSMSKHTLAGWKQQRITVTNGTQRRQPDITGGLSVNEITYKKVNKESVPVEG